MASFDCDRHCVEWVTFADWAHRHLSPLSTSFTMKLVCILLIKWNLKNGPEFPPYWAHVISFIGVLFFCLKVLNVFILYFLMPHAVRILFSPSGRTLLYFPGCTGPQDPPDSGPWLLGWRVCRYFLSTGGSRCCCYFPFLSTASSSPFPLTWRRLVL